MTFPAVETLVRDRIGLDPASLGAAAFPRAVEARMRARGVASADSYAGLLAADPVEWAALLAGLLIPESWFFRGGRAFFEYLARWVRDRADARPAGDPVRVLSAPCGAGEEPYSLALALDELGVPPAGYQIDGVDLSAEHLRRATEARYAGFAFRESGPDPRPRYFRPADDGKWELNPRFRAAVRLRPGNLVDPTFLWGEPPYDLILCRNLFIYLTPAARLRAVANLDRLLAPGGRLCLTPAEADRLPPGRFVPDGPDGFSLYRRAEVRSGGGGTGSGLFVPLRPAAGAGTPDAGPRSGVHRPVQPAAEAPPDPGPRSGVNLVPRSPAPAPPAAPRTNYEHRPLPPQPAPPPPPAGSGSSGSKPGTPYSVLSTPTADAVGQARALADAGRLDEARAVCERALAATPGAGLFSLLGVVHLAAGRRDDAAEAFRRALYLDPDHPEALTHMIVLSEQRGDPGQAASLRRRLARVDRGATA